MRLDHRDLTNRIISAAIHVHTTLGPGFLEAIYEAAFALELGSRGIPFLQEVPIPVLYRGCEVGAHRLDFLVYGQIVVELKTIRQLQDVHFAVVKSYLRAARREHGLILNFAKPTLEIRRVLAQAR